MCNMVAIAVYGLSLVGVVGLLYMAQQDSLHTYLIRQILPSLWK